MRLNQDSNETRFTIREHGDGYVIINEERLTQSLVLTPTTRHTQWPVHAIEDLDEQTLSWLIEDDPEVVLIGTGRQQAFPSGPVMGFFARRGLGVEFMDSAAACRTYAILASEGRRVALGLILQPAQ